MKGLLLPLLLSLITSSAWAATGARNFSVLAGMDKGGLALGANLDIEDTANEAYGAYARVFAKDRDEGEPALFALGAHFKGQLKTGAFRYYLSPGFGLVQRTYDETKLLLGPALNIGLNAELDKNVSLGIENSKLYSWIGKYKGIVKDAFLAQATFGF
jgi:hypothetical protein